MPALMRATRRIPFAALAAASIVIGCAGADWSPTERPTTSPVPSSTAGSAPTVTATASPTATVRSTAYPSPSAASPVASSPSPAGPDIDPSDVEAIRAAVEPLTGAPGDYDALIARLADADVVLLGEPSHGTAEVYEERAEITRRLIDEAGFDGLAIEGDWPDARRVERYIRGLGDDTTPSGALGDFDVFPEWMWRNEQFADLVAWLRDHNSSLSYARQAGVYGIDLYSIPESLAAVPAELRPFDPSAAARAERLYRCAGATGIVDPRGEQPPCSERVEQVLSDAIAVAEAVPPADTEQADDAFSAVQNARIVVNGRRYAIGAADAGESSWNIRDRHMAETIWALRDHLISTGRTGRLVVWAHNSHIGDARATDVARRGQLNLGQLAREQPGIESVLVGFSTYTGTVTAADNWDEPAEQMDVLPALPGSHPDLLHAVSRAGPADFLVSLGPEAPAPLHAERLERYIGVIYRADTERQSHYFSTRIADEYDVLIHLDETTAVQPLDEAGRSREPDD